MNFLKDCTSKSGNSASSGSKSKQPKEPKEVEMKKIGGGLQYRDVIKLKPGIPPLNKEKELSLDGIVKDPDELVSAKRWKKCMEQSSDPSVIATTFPGGIHGTVKKRKEDAKGISTSYACIESVNVPFKFYAHDSEDDDSDWVEPLSPGCNAIGNLPGYLRGLGISSFYNQEFDLAWENLNRGSKVLGVDLHIDEALTALECDIYQNKFDDVEKDCTKFDGAISKAVEERSISICDLFRWIEELRTSNRHYGAILLCRAVIFSLPSAGGAQLERNISLSYYVFIEMCLRAACISGLANKYSDIIKFMFVAMEKAIGKMKSCLPHCDVNNKDVVENIRRKIATCYVALSFYCNCFKLFKSAEKCIKIGQEIVSRHDKVRVDLCANYAASLIGQDKPDRAKDVLQITKGLLENMTERNMQDCVKRWRMKRIKHMIDVCWKLQEMKRKRLEFQEFESSD